MPKRKKSLNKHASQARSGAFVPSAPRLRVAAGIALVVLAVFLAYLPSINGKFVLDDGHLLSDNKLVKASDGLYRFWCTTEPTDYWPVTNTTFWMEWRLWGLNTTGYHVTNLILHIVESLLIWLILRKLSLPGAFLAAMIFAVHPVNVESVAWIAQRKNTMAMLFFLLSILFYLKLEIPTAASEKDRDWNSWPLAPNPSPLFYWLSLAAFVLAMLSKGSVAVLPVLLLGIVWWLGPLTKRDLLRTAPFFLVAVVLTGVNIWFQTHGQDIDTRTVGFAERLLGSGGVVWFYLYKAFLPIDLCFVYRQWHIEAGNLLWWLPLLAALIVTAVLWRYRENRCRPLLFAWGFFCVALVPVMGFTDVGFMKYSLVADHYQHIALIGVIALAAAGLGTWHNRTRRAARQIVNFIAIAAVGALIFLTWRQSELYRDPITLFQATLEKNPDCVLIRYNVGVALNEMGRVEEVIEQYQHALRIDPVYYQAHNNLGIALNQVGRPEEAIKHYRQVFQLKPDFAEAYNNMGNALENLGHPQEAMDYYHQALRLKPDYPECYYNLGNALHRKDQLPEAIEHYQQALKLKPNYADAHNNLGLTLTKAGRAEDAIKHFNQALQLKPNDPEFHNNLGNALFNAGRLPEAVEQYKQALRFKTDYIEAYNNLGAVLIQVGRSEEAISNFMEAIRFKPDYLNAYYNMAIAYTKTNQSAQAVATARKAIELAHSKGLTTSAKQIEDWLNSYQAQEAKGEEGEK